jgi:hypothetical protein
LLPVLLSIGPSLGDGATLRALSAAMAGRHVLLDAPARLCDVAAVLARAVTTDAPAGHIRPFLTALLRRRPATTPLTTVHNIPAQTG